MTSLMALTLAMIFGLLSTRLMKVLRLPNVTGYLIVGLLIGPSCFKLISDVSQFDLIIDIALGFIAFSIGSEFKMSSLKKIGKKVVLITFLQAFLALVLVDVGLMIVCAIQGTFNENLPLILILGAIATATAPAATLMVVKQYKARGKFTETLLFVVALDDVFGLILFSISFALSKVFANGGDLKFVNVVIAPLLEIIFSLGIGGILGLILTFAVKWFKSRANRLGCMIAIVFAGVALCEVLDGVLPFDIQLSSLLLCMMIGAVFCNLRDDAVVILDGCERWTPPLFMLFFIISSAELDLSILPQIGIMGIVYLIARSIGKYSGAFFGAVITKEDKVIRNYLGFALLPQAGVAIGMAKLASESLTNYSAQILTIVLCATLIYELIGPLAAKFALTKAGDIELPPKKKHLDKPNPNAC